MWIEVVPFGTFDERVEPGRAVAGGVVAGEEPVFSADGDRLHRALGGVVVDLQVASLDVAIERCPLVFR